MADRHSPPYHRGHPCVVARQANGDSLTIPEISQAEGISHHNVAKYLSILRKGGFVESERGQRGGYSLARRPEEIVGKEIVERGGGEVLSLPYAENKSSSGIISRILELHDRQKA